MLLRTHEAALELGHGQVISLSEAQGLEIRVMRGTLWITQENDERDRILTAGDHHFVGRSGLTVLTALNGAAQLVATQRHRPRTGVAARCLAATLQRRFRKALRVAMHPARLRNNPIATLHAA